MPKQAEKVKETMRSVKRRHGDDRLRKPFITPSRAKVSRDEDDGFFQTLRDMEEDERIATQAVEENSRRRKMKKPLTKKEWDAALKNAAANIRRSSSRDAWLFGFGTWAGDPEELKRLEAEVMKMRSEDIS
jgi:hypothetical protein